MNNHKTLSTREAGTPNEDEASFAYASGWNDAAKGLGFRKEYDGRPSPWQRNYEIGRAHFAASGRVRGLSMDKPISPHIKRLTKAVPAVRAEHIFHTRG